MMQVTFHLLSATDFSGSEQYVLKLIEKYYQNDLNVLLKFATIEMMTYWDDLIWSYSSDGFMPHRCLDGFHIQVTKAVPSAHTIAINLSLNPWIPKELFEHMHEIVLGNEQDKQKSRHNYKTYKEHQFLLDTISVHN